VEGAKVVVTYRKQEELDALKIAAGVNTAQLDGVAVDVTDEAAVRQLIEKIVGKYRRLDAMVNTVGGYAGGTKLWELDTKVFEQMLTLNLRSGYALSRAAVRAMFERGPWSHRKRGIEGGGRSCRRRSRIRGFEIRRGGVLDSLAEDLKGSGVRVNTILPSIIDTEANRKAMPKAILRNGRSPRRSRGSSCSCVVTMPESSTAPPSGLGDS